MGLPRTLFGRTGLVMATALLLLLLVSIFIFGSFVMKPTARQASEDAAALLVLSAQTWAELPPDTREDFEYELEFSHGIFLDEVTEELIPVSHTPYIDFLRDALEERMGGVVPVGEHPQMAHWFQVDLPVGGRMLRLSFPRDRFIPELPLALFWSFLAAAVLTFLATLLLVRHLTRPLALLSDAAVRFGRGASAEDLPEEGPEEIRKLTRSFNGMTVQLKQLMENRTTLLAGISHDLRTPIARLSLALEMLPADSDDSLQQQMHKDLKEMDQLIARTLELARNIENAHQELEHVDLTELVDGIVTEHQQEGLSIHWQPQQSCLLKTHVVALRRVVANLLENAIRYGNGEVEVRIDCGESQIDVEVLDNGPGIAVDELETVFQPFHRLEKSRNASTGGSGLGLAIVEQLCHANHWQIRLSNRFSGGLRASLTIEVDGAGGSN